MFVTRLISGIALVAMILGAIILGKNVMFALVLAISLIGLYELYRVLGLEKTIPGYIGFLFSAAYFILLYAGEGIFTTEIIMAFIILVLGAYVFTYPTYRAEQIMGAIFSPLYVCVMLSYLYRLRCMADGAFLAGLVFFCAWGSDTCAYCVGMLFGRHKMAPILSPKKSIEGAVGGVVGAALLCGLFGLYITKAGYATLQVENLPAIFAVIGAVGALISMVGDLAASAIKRNYEIKDYGNLIPGHGGILDRFDSIIITAPIIWTLAVLML